jgi:hypothetical protein
MNLNYDCVRDLLLVMENHIYFKDDLEYSWLFFDKVCELLPSYTIMKMSEKMIIEQLL